MDQDTNYGWDTNSWIRNNNNTPMWKLWNKPVINSESNAEKMSSFPTSLTQTFENENFETYLPSVQYVTSSPLILPSPPVRICKNSFGQQQHLLLSIVAHILVWICRLGIRRFR